ncbi:hypothetical protein IRB23M11_17000 [Alkalibacterium sp. m-11]|uniref:Uncharacterized protein n=1 Tax=Alkalibacterium pelagium TaxID=426702 RepID=A0A1H7JF99_9LACT|nr:hypothetical protein [Alkalibacterium pelagium]GEN50162.1 hypothetical protein APE02nite_08270 [Alkalibacterium pelagium]SEK73243.1 hypothetical protein SAMN04488099_105163 [Alkalibacterium pelagium]
MKEYDEYQNFKRYRNGFYALWILVSLYMGNLVLTGLTDIQWAETHRLESTIIIVFSVTCMTVLNVYTGAHFAKWENPIIISIISIISGLLFMSSSILSYQPIIEDGKLTMHATSLLVGLNFLALPVTYLVRISVEKIKDAKTGEEE